MNPAQLLLVSLGRAYQKAVSPVLTAVFGPWGGGCRFSPTCSQFAIEAVQRHGAWPGSRLAVSRLCRCHPWGGCGHDPVPTRLPTRQPRTPAPSLPHGS